MESGKYEGDNRKKYKTKNKEGGFLPTSKLNENKAKVNRKKTKEISNEFPNFTALTEEERLAFFEILNAARRNVDDAKESPGSEPFKNPQDELLEYFNGVFLQEGEIKKVSSHASPAYCSTYTPEEHTQEQIIRNSALNLSENFDSDDLFLLDKTFKCDSASLTSLSMVQNVKEKENYPRFAKTSCLSKRNSSCTEIETWDDHQAVLNKDQNKMVNFYLKSKKIPEKKKDSNKKSGKSSPLLDPTASDDTWSETTYDLSHVNFDFETMSNKKKKNEQDIETNTNLPVRPTPKFDSLSAEEKKIFFNVLQEAHENVLQKNSENERVLPFESIIKTYRLEKGEVPNYNEISLDSQTLRFQGDDHTNIKVKVTLTSADNQRLEKEREEEKYNRAKLLKGTDDSKKKEEVVKKDEPGDSTAESNDSLESCEEENENPDNKLTDKEEMNKLYNEKKKLMESRAKLTMKELEEEECDNENDKVIADETKATKPSEMKSSEPKKPESKGLQRKTSEIKEKSSAEWVAQKENPGTKKQQHEKRFLGLSKIKKDKVKDKGKEKEKDKDKNSQFKTMENEDRSSGSKADMKKEKEVVQVESVSVYELKKNKTDENCISQKSLGAVDENSLQTEKPRVNISVYRNETIEEGENDRIEETSKIKRESRTEIGLRDSEISENKPEYETDEIYSDSNTQNEKDNSERQLELQVLSSKVVAVSKENQNSIKTGKILEENSLENGEDQSQDFRGSENKYEQDNENDEKDKNYKTNNLKKIETLNETDFKCGKVVLVDDGVIEKIKQLIEDLEKNAKAEEDSLSNDYVQLLLDYISYLSRVLCSLVNKRDKNMDMDVMQVQTSLTSPNAHLKFEEKRKCKPKSKSKRAEVENIKGPLSVSATSLHVKEDSPREKDGKKTKLEEKKSSLLSTASEAPSEDEALWAPMFTKQKVMPSTKIRLLQDLLKERAKFVEGSISEFKVVKLDEKDYVPPEKPILRLTLEDEEEAFVEKAKFNFFKALFKFCRCGRKETGDENTILENLKGEAVAVDTSEVQAKNPASATINDSTMEVLKAAERKKIIQKYWKYN